MEKQTGTQAETNLVNKDSDRGHRGNWGSSVLAGMERKGTQKVILATGRMHSLSQAGPGQMELQEAWQPESAVPAESCGYLHAAPLWLFEGGRGQEVGREGL